MLIVERMDWVDAGRGTPGAPAAGLSDTAIGDWSVTLHRVLVARYGLDHGSDAAASAIAWAWEHRERLGEMDNPVGYLYRVGQSSLRHLRRSDRRRIDRSVDLLPPHVTYDTPFVDHDLFAALRTLTPDQRVAIVMVHMYGFSYRDVAGVIGASETAVTNHVHRGMDRLRRALAPAPAHPTNETTPDTTERRQS